MSIYRQLLNILFVAHNKDLGTLALLEQLRRRQIGHDLRQERVVEGLPSLLQLHIQHVVDDLLRTNR